MTNTEIVKLIINNLWDNQADVTLSDYIADDVKIKSPVDEYLPETDSPVAKMKAIATYWKGSFPDVTSEELSFEETAPGVIVKKWKAQGTHTGSDFFDVPQSNREVLYDGETTYTIIDGKLVEYEAIVNIDNIKSQLIVNSPRCS